MANKIKRITIKVHPIFFDNFFEPKRRSYENKFKVKISQVKLSEIIAKEYMNVKQPKKKYFPKKIKNRSFFTL